MTRRIEPSCDEKNFVDPPLQMTSLMSELNEPLCVELAGVLSNALARPVEFTTEIAFPKRHQLLDQQTVEIAWLCGLLYTVKVRDDAWCYTPTVAPCMVGEDGPLYTSHLIVPKGSRFHTIEDLRGATWAYNEEESFSGFQIMRALLHQLGEPGPYFASRHCSGSHLNSLDMVRRGQIDAAIIDSTMMHMIASSDPALLDQVRTLTHIGPYAVPLIALSPDCPPALRQPIQETLVNLHQTEAGAALLDRWQIRRFVAVEDSTYDDIRQMMAETSQIVL